VHQVAEFLAAEGILAELLDDGATIRVRVGFLDLLVGEAGESLLNEGADVSDPQEIDDFFVSQNGVGQASRHACEEKNDHGERANRIQILSPPGASTPFHGFRYG